MSTENFFKEQEEQSKVKTAIVSKYFWSWAKVILPSAKLSVGKIAYLDLFAGPGRYEDGAKSTPILILEQAIQDPYMRQMLVTMFNDKDTKSIQSLQNAISNIPNIGLLKYPPVVYSEEVGENMVKQFEAVRLVPTLFFVDPWGYKGLSLRLVNSVLKDWGCDCILFFNYNRINMGLRNKFVEEHMNALFGVSRADDLRARLEKLPVSERELAIVEEMSNALREMGGKFVLPFRFRDERGSRTSHHLIFVSKHFRGYDIMKGIMAKESSSKHEGVASFEYNPATAHQPFLLGFLSPLGELGTNLLEYFSGRTLTMRAIYEEHSVDRPFIAKNYKDCLKILESEERIIADPPASDRRKQKGEVTFADEVKVSFPKKG